MKRQLISRMECRVIQIRILKAIDDICEKKHIGYYIAYGSLLGAIRHKGFIPWDDDIDIIIPRKDYNKFLAVLKSDDKEIPEWMKIVDSETKGYYYPFAKIVDSRTCAKMDDNLTEHGIWIDVFPIDGLPNNNILGRIHINVCLVLRAIVISMTTDFSSSSLGERRTVKKILYLFAKIIGKKNICTISEKMMQLYSKDESIYVACLFSPYGQKEKVKSSVLFDSEKVEFEGEFFPAPKNWEEFLTRIYGNYMELPPVEKRRTHRIEAWYK